GCITTVHLDLERVVVGISRPGGLVYVAVTFVRPQEVVADYAGNVSAINRRINKRIPGTTRVDVYLAVGTKRIQVDKVRAVGNLINVATLAQVARQRTNVSELDYRVIANLALNARSKVISGRCL